MKHFTFSSVLSTLIFVVNAGYTSYQDTNFRGEPWRKEGNHCQDYETSWIGKSIKSDPGTVCFLFTTYGCKAGTCEVCVDDQGWADTERAGLGNFWSEPYAALLKLAFNPVVRALLLLLVLLILDSVAAVLTRALDILDLAYAFLVVVVAVFNAITLAVLRFHDR
ncbi:uncharacterized protein VTP21DRAFT_2262 [Calcarisporiella thermophila]|uniref:uncharacterized protein n=1 Tax=Calcarisporiella thermophila TaxID=911321 RepID=UPI0037442E6F